MKIFIKDLIALSIVCPMIFAYADVQAISMNDGNTYTNDGNKISIDCSGETGWHECNITYSNAKGHSKTIATDSHMDNDTVLFWHGSQYAEIRADVTRGGTFTILFNFSSMSTSQIINNVYGIDTKRNLIAVNLLDLNSSDQIPSTTYKILVTGLYDHSKGMYFNAPAGHDSNFDTNIAKTNFDEQGNLVIAYYPNSFVYTDSANAVFKIDPAEFQAIDPTIFERNVNPSSVINS